MLSEGGARAREAARFGYLPGRHARALRARGSVPLTFDCFLSGVRRAFVGREVHLIAVRSRALRFGFQTAHVAPAGLRHFITLAPQGLHLRQTQITGRPAEP